MTFSAAYASNTTTPTIHIRFRHDRGPHCWLFCQVFPRESAVPTQRAADAWISAARKIRKTLLLHILAKSASE